MEQGHSLSGFEIDRHALLVAIKGEEIGAHPVQGIVRVSRQQLAGTLTLQRLHLDSLCAQVGKDHATIGTGQHMRQVQYTHAIEWLAHLK